METDVVCPDCGKVIAPAGTVEEILRCRCGEQREPLSPSQVPSRLRTSIPIPPPQQPSRSAPTEDLDSMDDGGDGGSGDRGSGDGGGLKPSAEKTCYVCGASLAGRTRLKDHLGRYWCKECAAADQRAKRREAELRCPDCSRVFPEHKLVYFQTVRVCATCFKAREKLLEKKIVKSQIKKIEKTHEWTQLKWMAVVAGALILIATIFQWLR